MTAKQVFCENTRIAMAAERRRNPERALKEIRAARRMLPPLPSLALAAADCYERLGDLTRARHEYATALALDPSLDAPRKRLAALDVAEDAARDVARSILGRSGAAGRVCSAKALPDGEPLVVLRSEDLYRVARRSAAADVRIDLVRLVTEARDEALVCAADAGPVAA